MGFRKHFLSTEDESSIADVSEAFNISLRTLRFYESKGLLRPRRIGQTRLYSRRDRTRLEIILRGKRLGFTLAEIAEMMADPRRSLGDRGLPVSDLVMTLGAPQIADHIEQLERQRDRLTAAINELRKIQVKGSQGPDRVPRWAAERDRPADGLAIA